MKNILIISPIPIYPQNAGNRARIFTMCEFLKSKGHTVTFLYIDKEIADVPKMVDYFGQEHYFQFNSKPKNKSFFSKENFQRFITRKRRKFAWSKSAKYNRFVDEYYDPAIDDFIKKNLSGKAFTHIIVEYVVYSKALENFDSNTVKIIDTHDMLSDRYKLFLQQKLRPQWYTLFPEEEAKGLNRADIGLAIQKKEKDYFESISKTEIKEVGHLTYIKEVPSESSNTIVFVGSHNQVNFDALNHFIKNIFPSIVSQFPDIQLLIAGNIIERKADIAAHPNASFYGEYGVKEEIYSKGDIVVVPIIYGSGLKIKTVDALSCGKAVVAFDEGISGLEFPDAINPYCLVAEDDADFAEKVIGLLKDQTLREDLKRNALKYMNDYNSKMLAEIETILD